MTIDSDISAALPEPPPPRPARRDAAIAAALQRFDGGGSVPPLADRPRAATPASWRGRIARPQFAAFATIALVALIGLPVWMSGDHQFSSVSREAPVSGVPSAAPSAAPSVSPTPAAPGPVAVQTQARPSPTVAATPSPASPRLEPGPATPPFVVMGNSGDARCAGGNCNAPVDARATAGVSRYSLPEVQAMQENRLDKDVADGLKRRAEFGYAAPPPPPPQAAPAPPPSAFAPAPRSPVVAGLVDEKDTGGADIAVTGSRVSKSSNADLSSADIVVTGIARSAARRAGRGDWNACTVNDPSQSLSACRKLVDTAASGSAGVAATHIAEGLSLAWQDDLDGAIAAFDKAIAVSPRLSFAYLNRGQAYLRNGDLTRALADFDQAVRYAPNTARNYYSRSLVRRQQGDTRRAEADEARAIDLDERYDVLFR